MITDISPKSLCLSRLREGIPVVCCKSQRAALHQSYVLMNTTRGNHDEQTYLTFGDFLPPFFPPSLTPSVPSLQKSCEKSVVRLAPEKDGKEKQYLFSFLSSYTVRKNTNSRLEENNVLPVFTLLSSCCLQCATFDLIFSPAGNLSPP